MNNTAIQPVEVSVPQRSVPKSKLVKKTAKTRRATASPSATLSYDQFQRLTVVAQVRRAFMPGARLAAVIGTVLGGFIPLAVWVIVHFAIVPQAPLWEQVPAFLAAGGLMYSAKTVFVWAKAAFGDAFKAVGFVVLLEGILTFLSAPQGANQYVSATIHGVGIFALVILMFINSVSAACALQVRKEIK